MHCVSVKVNGPEILNKYVGASEENIRKLFEDAEKEYKAQGANSQLHIVIFDEIDAICKQRGSKGDSTGVSDSIVIRDMHRWQRICCQSECKHPAQCTSETEIMHGQCVFSLSNVQTQTTIWGMYTVCIVTM